MDKKEPTVTGFRMEDETKWGSGEKYREHRGKSRASWRGGCSMARDGQAGKYSLPEKDGGWSVREARAPDVGDRHQGPKRK